MGGPSQFVVLGGQLSNPAPSLCAALNAYHKLKLNTQILPRTGQIGLPRKLKILTKAEVESLVTGYEAGAKVRELGKQFGVHRHTVSKHLQAQGIEMRHRPLTPDQVTQAIQLYRQGWSLARVVQHFERDATLIHLVLKRAGVARRDSHGRQRF